MIDRYIAHEYVSSIENTINRLNEKINKLDLESVLLENRLNEKIDQSLIAGDKVHIEEPPKIEILEEKIDDIDKKIEKKSKLTKLLFVSRFI